MISMSENKEQQSKYYLVATTIGSETKVIEEMKARLSDFGSLQEMKDNIISIGGADHIRGYIVVVSTDLWFVEKLIGDNTNLTGVMKLKNVRKIVGEVSQIEAQTYLAEKDPLEGILIGSAIHIKSGAFRGEKAEVLSIKPSIDEVIIELVEHPVPMLLHVSSKDIELAN
jgi:transcription elongation factor Spt5